MAKRKGSSAKRANRLKALKGFAKATVDFRPGLDMVKRIGKGDVLGAIKTGLNHTKEMGRHVINAITGHDSNARSWYVVYKDVTPAANENRPMGALFNTLLTKNPTMGTTCRYSELLMKWEDFTNTYMWKQTMNNSFQLLRLKLKSNLPYDVKRLSVYLNDAIQLSIALKQVERDVHWYNYSSPEYPDFAEMFSLRAGVVGGYGPVELDKDKLLTAGLWSETLTSYDRLKSVVRTNLKLPPNLAAFISHYFGSVFVDGPDGYNDQTIILRMTNLVWQEINADGEVITTEFDATKLTIDELTNMVSKLGTEFGIVIADLVNSEQYTPLYLDAVEEYDYTFVFDRTLLQAMQNGYTDSSAVINESYIRLDRYYEIDDELTQFIFAGGYAPREDGALANVPAITILAHVLKYNSSQELEWPAGITQGESLPYIKRSKPFGIKVSTSITEDVYVEANQSISTAPWPTSNTQNFANSVITNSYHSEGVGLVSTGKNQVKNPEYEEWVFIPISRITVNGLNYTAMLAGKIPLVPTLDEETPMELQTVVADGELLLTIMQNLAPTSDAPTLLFNQINHVYLKTGSLTLSNAEHTAFKWLKGEHAYTATYYIKDGPSQIITTRVYMNNAADVSIQIQLDATFPDLPPELSQTLNITGTESWYSLTQATRTGEDATEPVITASVVTGFSQLAELYAKETHAGIPIVTKSRTRVVINGEEGEQEVLNSETLPMLLKHEHVPYFYNIIDLQAVLYDMFNSLFTPTNNIYELLLRRKASYDNQMKSKAKARAERKKGKEDNNDPDDSGRK